MFYKNKIKNLSIIKRNECFLKNKIKSHPRDVGNLLLIESMRCGKRRRKKNGHVGYVWLGGKQILEICFPIFSCLGCRKVWSTGK